MNFQNSLSFAPEGSWGRLRTDEEGCGKDAEFFSSVQGLLRVLTPACMANDRSL
jgi:hypothetical protein